MSEKLTLIFFNGKGRAEHIRYIFAAAGRDYEDKRLSFEEFATFKSGKRDPKRLNESLTSISLLYSFSVGLYVEQ